MWKGISPFSRSCTRYCRDTPRILPASTVVSSCLLWRMVTEFPARRSASTRKRNEYKIIRQNFSSSVWTNQFGLCLTKLFVDFNDLPVALSREYQEAMFQSVAPFRYSPTKIIAHRNSSMNGCKCRRYAARFVFSVPHRLRRWAPVIPPALRA